MTNYAIYQCAPNGRDLLLGLIVAHRDVFADMEAWLEAHGHSVGDVPRRNCTWDSEHRGMPRMAELIGYDGRVMYFATREGLGR